MDATASASVLALLSPLLVIVSFMVWWEDRGPILYATLRSGRGGVPFRMYKFRTMVVNADQIGGSSTPSGDPRVTGIGRHLRRWKVDELPQLVNVLKGEMSLVGPRPQVPEAVEKYSPAERELLEVLPGMTDWASIKFRDEGGLLQGMVDPDLAYDQLIRPGKSWLGLQYVHSASMCVDLQILAKTVLALLRIEPRVIEVPADAEERLGLAGPAAAGTRSES